MRVGVIGCGGHATSSIYPVLSQAGMRLVATCARHLDRAEETATRFGAERAFDRAEDMLEKAELDAALVIVGPDDYAPLVRLCLDAGLPVFTEKPGAGSSAEAGELAAAAAAAGRALMVGYMKRFAPAYRQAKAVMSDPAFGAPTLASFTFAMGPWGRPARDYLIDNPVHPLDLARFLVGELSDLAIRKSTASDGYALGVAATASSGAAVTFQLCTTASWIQRNESVEIFGAGHSVYVDNIDTCIHRPPERPELVWRPNYTVPIPMNTTANTMGFLPELEHFRAVVTEGVPCESDMASAARTLELAENLVELYVA